MSGAGGDMCASLHCSDLALPGHELCAGCYADVQVERDRVDAEAARLTAEHQERVEAQETAA